MQRRVGFSLYLVECEASGKPVGICGLLKRETLLDVDLGFASLRDSSAGSTRSKLTLRQSFIASAV